MHTSQRDRKRIYNYNFSKKNILKEKEGGSISLSAPGKIIIISFCLYVYLPYNWNKPACLKSAGTKDGWIFPAD